VVTALRGTASADDLRAGIRAPGFPMVRFIGGSSSSESVESVSLSTVGGGFVSGIRRLTCDLVVSSLAL